MRCKNISSWSCTETDNTGKAQLSESSTPLKVARRTKKKTKKNICHLSPRDSRSAPTQWVRRGPLYALFGFENPRTLKQEEKKKKRNTNCIKKDWQSNYTTVMQLHTKTAGRDGRDCMAWFGRPNGFSQETLHKTAEQWHLRPVTLTIIDVHK